MCQQGVSLHLSKSNTPCPLPPLHGLMRENINRTSCANLKKQRHQTAALPFSIWCIDTGVPFPLPFSSLVHCIPSLTTYLEFVSYHVSQPLVVHDTKEDISLKFPAINATVQTLIAKVVVTSYRIQKHV